MTLSELMRSRRSVRRFKPDRPERALIQELIEMAITAPSASNNQPWRFFVSDDRDTIDRMAATVQAAVDRLAHSVDGSHVGVFRAYGDYFVRFAQAPVVIVPAFRPLTLLSHMMDEHLGVKDHQQIEAVEYNSGLTSTAMAAQNLLLYAHSVGLGASCLTGPLLAAQALKSILGIPHGWDLASVIAVGYAAEDPAPTPRKAVSTILRWVPPGGGAKKDP